MTRFTLAIDIYVELPNEDEDDLGLQMGFGTGAGPTELFIETADVHREGHKGIEFFSVNDGLRFLGNLTAVAAFNEIADFTEKKPWSKIFDVQMKPRLSITPLETHPSARASLVLKEPGHSVEDGVTLGGTMNVGGLEISFEPDLTVYELIAEYEAGAKGFDLRARVKISPQEGSETRGIEGKKDQKPKTEIVSYPFPVPTGGTGRKFELKYLGLGQRFGPPVDTTSDDPMEAIFKKLHDDFTTNDPQKILATMVEDYYHPDRGWFIGADIAIKGWEVRAIFNDPTMYGLEVTASASALAGLKFEILYQKLGPHLGVYYGALSLPERFRTIELGAVSLTIPSFALWIYTNGDFKVQVGWPPGKDSISIQFEVFIGGGGFYFAKLRSGDHPDSNKKTARIQAFDDSLVEGSVDYNPILEFGLAAWFGVGRSFRKGVFSAEATLKVEGIFEGVLAWESSGGSLSKPPDYFWFSATATIVGVLEASIDLKILTIKASIKVSVSANVALETDLATLITVSADVDVKGSVRIAFVTIHVRFTKHISHSFKIGSGEAASPQGPRKNLYGDGVASRPKQLTQQFLWRWPTQPKKEPTRVDAGMPPRLKRMKEAVHALDRSPFASAAAPLGDPITSLNELTVTAHFLLFATTTYDEKADGINQAVASLVLPATIKKRDDDGEDSAFHILLTGLARWCLKTYGIAEDGQQSWRQVDHALGSGWDDGPGGFYDALIDYLHDYVTFEIDGLDLVGDHPDLSAVPFPVFPVCKMSADGHDDPITFGNLTPVGEHYDGLVQTYFDELSLTRKEPEKLVARPAMETGARAMAHVVFEDYFLTMLRYLADEMIDIDADLPTDAVSSDVAQAVAHFMLHGLRLPDPQEIDNPTEPWTWGDDAIGAAFELTGQRVSVPADSERFKAVLSVADEDSKLAEAIRFVNDDDGTDEPTSASSCLPVSSPPSPPDPTWTLVDLNADAGTMTAVDERIAITLTPAMAEHPWTFAVRQRMPWRDDGDAAQHLTNLPEPLLTAATVAGGATLNAHTLDENGDSHSLDCETALVVRIKAHKVRRYRDFHLRLVDGDDGEVPGTATKSEPHLENIYRIDGADDDTREKLEQALSALGKAEATVQLGYEIPGKKGVTASAVEASNVVVSKTNLSTIARPNTQLTPMKLMTLGDEPMTMGPTAASLDDPESMAALLWENSVVHASGFYLYYGDDAGGLPEEAFSEGSAELVFLFRDNSANEQRAHICPYHNAALLSGAVEGTVRFELAKAGDDGQKIIGKYHPTVPPGCAGIEMEWDFAALDAEAGDGAPFSADSIARLYHMMQLRFVESDDGGTPSLWSAPLGPRHERDEATDALDNSVQHYREVLPVYRFRTDGEQPPGHTTDRYGAVGHRAIVDLRLLDLYGDPLPVNGHRLEVPVYYNDPIITPECWPGINLSYRVISGEVGAAILRLQLSFGPEYLDPVGRRESFLMDGSSAMDKGETGKKIQRAKNARRKLNEILTQLSDPRVSVGLTTTLGAVYDQGQGGEQTVGDVVSTWLRQAAEKTIAALDGYIENQTIDGVQSVLDLTIPLNEVTAEKFFSVDVEISFERPADLVCPQVDADSGVGKAVTTVAPAIKAEKTGDKARRPGVRDPAVEQLRLRRFARDFEAAFYSPDSDGGYLKLAVRPDDATGSTHSQGDYLWGMKMGGEEGIDYEALATKPVYFALAPLSTTLLDTSSLHSQSPSAQRSAKVDLDQWAQRFLGHVDDFLRPSMASHVARIAPDKYAELMENKAALAHTIAKGVEPVVIDADNDSASTPRGDIDGARDRFEQALLEELSQAYEVESITQKAIAVTGIDGSDSDTPAPRLHGKLCAASDDNGDQQGGAKQYTLTTAKLPLKQADENTPYWLTFLVDTTHPDEQAGLSLDLDFQPTFVEHSIELSHAHFGYVPSSWVKFVFPDGGEEASSPGVEQRLGHFDVPIPLRSYPVSPAPREQSATPADSTDLAALAEGSSIGDLIEKALKWNYCASVDHGQRPAADELWIKAVFNVPVEANEPIVELGRADNRRQRLERLCTAFADFFDVWETSVAPNLDAISSGEEDQKVRDAITAMITAVTAVEKRWAELYEPSPQGFDGPPSRLITWRYVIDFARAYQESDSVLQVYAEPAAEGQPRVIWPTINGESPRSEVSATNGLTRPNDWDSRTYPFKAIADEQLRLGWPERAATTFQTATSSYYVVRNANLPTQEGSRVNPDFIYETDAAEFPSPVLPYVDVQRPIVVKSAETLKDTLSNIFEPFARALHDEENAQPCELKVECTHGTVLGYDSSDEPLLGQSAVLLVEGFGIGESDRDADASLGGLVDSLCDQMTTWYREERFPASDSIVDLDIRFLAATPGTRLPIARLANVRFVARPDMWSAEASSGARRKS